MRAPSSGQTRAAVAAQAISAAMIQKLIGMEVAKSSHFRTAAGPCPCAAPDPAWAHAASRDASGQGRGAQSLREGLEEARAGLELGNLDVLVRLVRDGDVARAADHRRYARGNEETGLGPEAHASRRRASAQRHERFGKA